MLPQGSPYPRASSKRLTLVQRRRAAGLSRSTAYREYRLVPFVEAGYQYQSVAQLPRFHNCIDEGGIARPAAKACLGLDLRRSRSGRYC
jgi:hypothetical protein